VRALLQSYRWRRRFAWAGGFVVVLIGFVAAALLLPKDHGRKYVLVPTGTEPAQTVETVTKQVRLTAAERRAINGTLVAFVRTAVTRADPAAAWDLATPAMRSGVDRKQWDGGELPVQPFPARISDKPSWNLLAAYSGDVTIDLVLQPQATSRRGPIAFAVELKKQSRDGRWLVDSMIPEQAFAPATPAKSPKPVNVPNGKPPAGALSQKWFIVPGVLLGLIALAPILILLNTWRRNRAIERRYRAERGL
jgi:hypothetical protein